MNVVILTPDRVGSTLLQRLITVYMQFHEFDRPVINLHELTNGIIKYYSEVFKAEVLGKGVGQEWGYHQTLPEIQELLASVPHYKTSRLAQYHIVQRKDSIGDQIKFYEYLNENFFVISCQRDNLFEHALSWGIVDHSKRLNVYSVEEKFEIFSDIYKNKITVDPDNITKYLDRYKNYLTWVNDNFQVQSYFRYDRDLQNIEDYILNLGIFNNQPRKISWQDTFGLGFKEWNALHYHISDLSGIGNQLKISPNNDTLKIELDSKSNISLDELKILPVTKTDKLRTVNPALRTFMVKNLNTYLKSTRHLSELVENKILTSGVPFKLQTLVEKKLLIKNYRELIDVYNNWVCINCIGQVYREDELSDLMVEEIENWHIRPLLN